MQRRGRGAERRFLHALRRTRRARSSRSSSPPSLDGRSPIATGRSRWISGPRRATTCTGSAPDSTPSASAARTRAPDDPSLTVRGAVEPRRHAAPRRLRPAAICSADAHSCGPRARRPTTVFVAPGTGRRAGARSPSAGVRRAPADGRSPRRCARCATRGSSRCWSRAEGGSPARCSREDLVDRLYWVQCPLWLGERRAGRRGLPATPLDQARALDAWSSVARWARIRCWWWTGADVYRHRHRGRDGVARAARRTTGSSSPSRALRGSRAGREHRGGRRLPHGGAGRRRRVRGARDRAPRSTAPRSATTPPGAG